MVAATMCFPRSVRSRARRNGDRKEGLTTGVSLQPARGVIMEENGARGKPGGSPLATERHCKSPGCLRRRDRVFDSRQSGPTAASPKGKGCRGEIELDARFFPGPNLHELAGRYRLAIAQQFALHGVIKVLSGFQRRGSKYAKARSRDGCSIINQQLGFGR